DTGGTARIASAEPGEWPKREVLRDSIPAMLNERSREHHVLHTAEETTSELLNLSSYSRLLRPLRVTAWILRFIANSRNKHERAEGPLTTEELGRAENYWILKVQSAYRIKMANTGGNR
ncbi:hypothetical protein IscW_ISCW011783, partial [Ixodes scapularis]